VVGRDSATITERETTDVIDSGHRNNSPPIKLERLQHVLGHLDFVTSTSHFDFSTPRLRLRLLDFATFFLMTRQLWFQDQPISDEI